MILRDLWGKTAHMPDSPQSSIIFVQAAHQRKYSFLSKGYKKHYRFKELIVPRTVMESSECKSSRRPENNGRIHTRIETKLAYLLEREVSLFIDLERIKKKIYNSGTTVFELFQEIDIENTHSINEDILESWLDSSNCIDSNIQIPLVISRLDKDRDGKVSYLDFLDSLIPYEDDNDTKLKEETSMSIANTSIADTQSRNRKGTHRKFQTQVDFKTLFSNRDKGKLFEGYKFSTPRKVPEDTYDSKLLLQTEGQEAYLNDSQMNTTLDFGPNLWTDPDCANEAVKQQIEGGGKLMELKKYLLEAPDFNLEKAMDIVLPLPGEEKALEEVDEKLEE